MTLVCVAMTTSTHASAETKMYQCGKSISNTPCAAFKHRAISRYQPPDAYERMASGSRAPSAPESQEAPAAPAQGQVSGGAVSGEQSPASVAPQDARGAVVNEADLEGMLHQLKIEPPTEEDPDASSRP